MTYEKTLEYLYSQLPMYQNVGKDAVKKDLKNIKKLCKSLDDPQGNFKSIHIAGTNGKGSVAHILAAAFQSEGLKVGLYTSPHYKDFRERIKINGKYITKKKVIDFTKHLKAELPKIKASFFEITVAMAFDYFAEKEVDIAIIETGLGGRLDSTNILKPELSVITNISLDHTDMLGNDKLTIAEEKAGIIKTKVPVIIGESDEEVLSVFSERAEKTKSKLKLSQEIIRVKPGKESISHLHISFKYLHKRIHLNAELVGPYQGKNLQTALAAYLYYRTEIAAQQIKWDSLKANLADLKKVTNYQGRWQILSETPMTITDSAHNIAGISLITARLRTLNYAQLHVVIGFVSDKDWHNLLKLFPKQANYYYTAPQIRRALDRKVLEKFGNSSGRQGRSYKSVASALRAAQESAEADDLIFIGGSTFVVAEVI